MIAVIVGIPERMKQHPGHMIPGAQGTHMHAHMFRHARIRYMMKLYRYICDHFVEA